MKKPESPHPTRTASSSEGSAARPTDLELMQLFDDELPEPRRTAVAAFVAANGGARAKLDGLADIGLFLRSSVDADDPFAGNDLAARIFARASAEDDAPASARTHDPIASSSRGVTSSRTTADGPRPSPRATLASDRPANTRPANDNARRIFGLAGVAAVAAAALVYWGRTAPVDGPGPTANATGRDPGALVAPRPSTDVATTAGTSGDTTPEPTPAPLDEGGVEVASVDFGRRSGAIFHVPTDARGPTTTVLWLSDE